MRPPITKNIGKKLVPPSILPRADVPLTIDATVDKDLGIVQDRLINIKDTRKVRRTTGQPLKPTERRAGNIPEGLIKDIVGYAKTYGVNPYEALSRAIIESEGNPTYNNPFHLLYNPESNPAISKIKDSYRSGVEAGIVALKQKEKEFKDLVKKGKIAPRPPDKMEMLKLQMYNGLGRLFPDTEGAKGWMYGVKIPKEGIKMTENPLYAKELLDIMDVVKLNPSVKTIVEQAKPITKTTQYGPLKNQDYANYFTGPELFAKGGPVYNWIPPNYPRVGARNKQGGWLEKYADGGDVPHDYMYSQGNVSSYRPGTSIHPIGMTNVPDSPCGPGFTIQYDETGNPVCMPIAELAPSAPTAPTPVLAGANQRDYDLFNPAVYKQSPLVTYSVEKTARGRNKEERFKPTKEERQATRKAIKASSLHRRPFLSGIGQFFRNVGDTIQRCLPGDDCYKFEAGGSIENQKIPDTTAYEFGDKFMAYPDPTLTNYQNLSPKSTLPDGKIVDATPNIPAYAHGATVWTKQTTPSWVAGTPTRTTTQRITPQRAQSPGTQVPYPEIKITGPTNPYMPASPPVLQGYNPYKGPMRLHAPDTRRMAYGGYVPMYKSGGFLSTLGDIGLGLVDNTLGTVGSVTGIKSMQDMIDEDQYANDKFDDVANFTGKIAGTALKVIPVTAPFAAAAGAVGTVANKALKIDEKNYDPTKHTSSWDKWGSGIEAVGGIASMAMGNVSGAAGAANTLSKAAQTANTITKGANLVNAGMGLTQGLGQGQIDFNSLMGLYGGIQGLQGSTTPSITKAKHGGRIPGLRWHQLNPGVSAPEGIYTGPTNQRGITFADGGDVLETKPMLAAGPSAAMSTDPRQPKLGVVGMGYAGGKYNPYIQGKAGIQGGSLEAGISPYLKVDRNFTLNPSLGGGVSTAGLYGKAGLTGMYNLPNNLNFDLYGSAEYMQDARGGSLPIELGLAWSDTNPLVRTGVSYDPLQKTVGASFNFPIGAERNLFKYKAKPKSKSRYEEGGEIDITKPYLNPATVQATLARAQQPVTNTLGRVISTPASREKERREKIIANDQSKYSVEDYKKGIQEPGAGNSVLDDPIAMAIIGTATGGVGLGSKTLGNTAKSFGRNLVSEVTGGLSDLPSISKASFPKNVAELSGTGFRKNPYYHYNAFKDKKQEIVDALRTPEGRKRLQGYIDNNAQYRPHILNKSTDEIIDDFDKTQFDVVRPIFKDGQWLRDEKGNLIYELVDPNNAYNWYRDGFNKPAYVSMGQNFPPYDTKHILEHEFAHTFQRQLPLSEVDDPLKNISLKEDREFNEFGLNDLKQLFNQYNPFNKTKDVGYSVSGDIYGTSRSLPSYYRSQGLQDAKNYWLEGSGGKEKSPFAAEVRENLRQRGLLKNRYDEITPDLLKQHYKLYNKTKGPKYNLRLYDIMHPTKENFNILSGVLNKMPAVLPAVAVGAQAMQQDNNKKSSGGWLDNL